ncbi:hypothetical protein ANCDUO_06101 [Ancylostoma duodenale]|uniref:NTR domain-containing protein n=1 Tax=Ancylostoma duodenale TaxID=51022 RepID=A0A0C2H2E0_9BILA|nr:hypothetical protein ANCDUO_06101 [Ancylostoma duodenale]
MGMLLFWVTKPKTGRESRIKDLINNEVQSPLLIHTAGCRVPTGPMISLVVFIACLTAANAKCSCKPFESLMEAFCQSDYALLATVKKINFVYGELPTNDTNTTDGGKWSYYIWHSGKTWKGPIVAASLLTTPNSEDACGVPGLSANVEYFLTGKLEGDEFTFTSCDFVMPSSDLAPQEYELLMQLMWYPKKCAEKHDEHVFSRLLVGTARWSDSKN